MDTVLSYGLKGKKREQWLSFLSASGLYPSDDAEFTVLIEQDGEILATASRCRNVFKYIAVSPEMQGMNLTAALITELQKEAFAAGISHLFIYTKPANRHIFEPLHFFEVSNTDEVLLMENTRNGVSTFLNSQPKIETSGTVGAAVMNCNPFTLGHRYLIEQAAAECSHFYVFALSEDRSLIPADHRLQLIKEGVADLKNVTVCQTGDYLISSATFPDYFLKRESSATLAQCKLDVEIFACHFAPYFNITTRFAGTEPISEVTGAYNRTMSELLPQHGIRWVELPRLELDGEPVSASRVRALLGKNKAEELKKLVPATTYLYLESNKLI